MGHVEGNWVTAMKIFIQIFIGFFLFSSKHCTEAFNQIFGQVVLRSVHTPPVVRRSL